MTEHEQAAFGGARQFRPLPRGLDGQGRYITTSDADRIEAEEDGLDAVCLSWPERLMLFAIWCAGMSVSVAVLWWLLS